MPPVDAELLYEDILPAGTHTSLLLRRGNLLRLTDLEGGANVAALLFNHEEPLERYNMPDTLKAQHTAFLTTGNVCYSDMGRILVSIVDDSCGWHDTIGGVTHDWEIEERFGKHDFQDCRNAMYRSGRLSLLTEIGKYGLGKRDMHANVNFFSKVQITDDGSMNFVPGHSKAGSFVELRAEMNVLLALSSTPHPLDPSPTFVPKPVQLQVRRADVVTDDDLCRTACEQNGRGFTNTERYWIR